MGTTVGLAILSFFISMGIGFFILIGYGKNWFPGFSFVFLIYYIPIVLIGSGIVFTLPIYLLLKQMPFVVEKFGKIMAFLIILFVIILALFILPK
jgi:hypothetical protein